MVNNIGKKVAILVLAMGLISFALGGFFVQQGFAKADMLTTAMSEQKISYGSAGGTITGVIDTPQEAQAMADILTLHLKQYGNYAELKKDDPARQTILNGMTMVNSLEMAVMGIWSDRRGQSQWRFHGPGGIHFRNCSHTRNTQERLKLQ
jgi:hypothetical protein